MDTTLSIPDLLKTIDLLALIEHDLGAGRRSGKDYMFSCPLPGHKNGDRRPSLSVTPVKGLWYCFGCQVGGNAITWLMVVHKVSGQVAYQTLLAGDWQRDLAVIQQDAPKGHNTDVPSSIWQEAGFALMKEAQEILWSSDGKPAMKYLQKERLLSTDTIQRWHLGYLPKDRYVRAASWGLSEESGRRLYIPSGIVIPGLIGEILHYIKIRRRTGEEPKYWNIRGGRPALFGANPIDIPELWLLTEGEFDTMLASQEIGDVISVATLGAAGKRIDLTRWGGYFLHAKAILVAYDQDGAGDLGSSALTELSGMFHRIRIPVLQPDDKDITDFCRSGGNLWEWIKPTLDKVDPVSDSILLAAAQLGAKVTQTDGKDTSAGKV